MPPIFFKNSDLARNSLPSAEGPVLDLNYGTQRAMERKGLWNAKGYETQRAMERKGLWNAKGYGTQRVKGGGLLATPCITFCSIRYRL